jgi:hypothetical protein
LGPYSQKLEEAKAKAKAKVRVNLAFALALALALALAERKGSTLGRLHHNLFKRVKREYGPKYDPNFDWTKKNLMLH